MNQRVFVIEFGTANVELLADAGASRERITVALEIEGATHSMLTTSDFSELDRWRLILNREACRYRYGEIETGEMREMGRSRSPDWV